MLNFTGFCTYPLGGYITTILFVTTCAAVITTIYATISCRFAVVTYSIESSSSMYYDNNDGTTSFEDYFYHKGGSNTDSDTSNHNVTISDINNNNNNTNTDTNVAVYRTSVGLYQWLRPNNNNYNNNYEDTGSSSSTSITDWTVGTCVGYQQTMLYSISDIYFELSRIMSIFAILIGIFQCSWMFLSSCLSMNIIQLYLFLFLSIIGTICTGLTFLFYQSTLCTTEFNQSVYCYIDQGGLVMIASIVLWIVTLCISIYYVIPVVRLISSNDSIEFELNTTKKTLQEQERIAFQRQVYKEYRRQRRLIKKQREEKRQLELQQQQQQQQESGDGGAGTITKSSASHQHNRMNSTGSYRKKGLPLYISTSEKDMIQQQQQNTHNPTTIVSKNNNNNNNSTDNAHRYSNKQFLARIQQQQHQQSSMVDDSNNSVLRNSYSFDSKESWLRPIPKRLIPPPAPSAPPQQQSHQSHRRSKSLIIDHTTAAQNPISITETAKVPYYRKTNSLSRIFPLPVPVITSRNKQFSPTELPLPPPVIIMQDTGDVEVGLQQGPTNSSSYVKNNCVTTIANTDSNSKKRRMEEDVIPVTNFVTAAITTEAATPTTTIIQPPLLTNMFGIEQKHNSTNTTAFDNSKQDHSMDKQLISTTTPSATVPATGTFNKNIATINSAIDIPVLSSSSSPTNTPTIPKQISPTTESRHTTIASTVTGAAPPSTTSATTATKNPLDLFISERLDRIEMITNMKHR